MAKQPTKYEVIDPESIKIPEGSAALPPPPIAIDLTVKMDEFEKLHAQMMAEKNQKIDELLKCNDELEEQVAASRSDAQAMTDRHNDLVLQVANQKQQIAEMDGVLRQMVPGKQLADEGEFEVVIVRRKKVARPTGRIIPRANIRLTVEDRNNRDILRSEGARLNEETSEHVHQVMLTPAPPGRDPKAYTVPEQMARELVSKGHAVDELR